MNKGSAYWLKETRNPNDKFDLIELANTQRAITNFVKIQTGKEIPVDFIANNEGDSMTDGKKIAISSTINTHNLDSVIGTALHEAAHCKYTDFFVLKKIAHILELCKFYTSAMSVYAPYDNWVLSEFDVPTTLRVSRGHI